MYTVEQIVQAISTLGPVEKKRLWRELSALEKPQGETTQHTTEKAKLDGEPDYVLIFDGGSKGNPGAGYGSYALSRRSAGVGSRRVYEHPHRLEFEDEVTNNEAEYDTLIAALESLLREMAARGEDPAQHTLEVRGDSRLVMQQLQGYWKAKEERMRERRNRALKLLRRFGDFRLKEVPRSESVSVLGH